MNLSVVIPAHNEAEVVEPTLRGLTSTSGPEGIDYEIVVVDDGSRDGTGDVGGARGGRGAAHALRAQRGAHGFGYAVRAGLEAFTGDAVAIVMADGSDDPRDVVLYYRVLEAGYDCAFGSRFMPGADVHDYPRLKLLINRVVNAGIRLLFRHGYNDTTNAFKAYRREVVENLQPADLAALQPDGRAAAEGGHPRLQLRDRAHLVDQPRGGDVEAAAEGDGQPLPVHRALRVPRAPPQPRRLPPPGRPVAARAAGPRALPGRTARRIAGAPQAAPPPRATAACPASGAGSAAS